MANKNNAKFLRKIMKSLEESGLIKKCHTCGRMMQTIESQGAGHKRSKLYEKKRGFCQYCTEFMSS